MLTLFSFSRHDAHCPAAGAEVWRPGLHPCLHQDLPEDPGLVPRLRLHAVQHPNGGGDDSHQVGAGSPVTAYPLPSVQRSCIFFVILLFLKPTLSPSSPLHSIIGCRLPKKDGCCRTERESIPSTELPAVWEGQEVSHEARN